MAIYSYITAIPQCPKHCGIGLFLIHFFQKLSRNFFLFTGQNRIIAHQFADIGSNFNQLTLCEKLCHRHTESTANCFQCSNRRNGISF